MPDTSPNQSSGDTDRPDDVTDPLLWKLALNVADAHEPDDNGGCRNLLCAGQPWPCAAWNNAQRALRAAQGGAPEAAESSSVVAVGQADPPDHLTGWPSGPAPTASPQLRPGASPQSRRESEAATSAA